MKPMKQILWNIKNDTVVIADNYSVNATDLENEYISGEIHKTDSGWKIVLHQDDVTAPANLDYFVRLWNATYPDKVISTSDIHVADKLVTAASKIIVPEKRLEKIDYDQYPEFGHYMNSPGHIHPDEDPDTMKMRNRLVGRLGEMIIRQGGVPGMQILSDDEHDVEADQHPVDALFNYDAGSGKQPFAAEIKASSGHNLRPYKYIVTGYGAKSSKKAVADKLSHTGLWEKYSPATIGITMRYDDNAVDAYMLPHAIGSFSKSAKGAIPLIENMPFDFNGFHPSPYHQSRVPEKRIHGVDWRQKYEESPRPEDVF